MEKKKYSSYAEIESELEILKVQREINFQKVVLSVQKTKESLQPINIVKGFLGDYKFIMSDWSVTIMKVAIPLVINWLKNRKRGD